MNDLFQIIQAVFTILTPFVLAYVAYRATRKEKNDDKYKMWLDKNLKLEKEIATKKQKELDNIISELQSDVQILKTDISGVRKNISTLSEEVKMVNCTLKDLLKFNSVNLQYSQSLSGLITTIGENIKHGNDCATDTSIKKAIELHQQKERELFSSILKSSC